MKGRYAAIYVQFAAARAQVPTQNDAILEGITRCGAARLAALVSNRNKVPLVLTK